MGNKITPDMVKVGVEEHGRHFNIPSKVAAIYLAMTAAKPVDGDAVRQAAREEAELAEYLEGYSFRGDADYTPNESERLLIEDALRGWVADHPAVLVTPQPHQLAAVERVVAWLREQSGKGADVGVAAGKGTTRRAAFGGGSLALKLAADAIEAGEYLNIASPPPVNGGEVIERVRLALEDAGALERVAEEADDNNWQDWAATMRQAADRIRALANSSSRDRMDK